MIYRARKKDAEKAGMLAARLWPGHTREEMTRELSQLMEKEDAAVFLLEEGGEPCGFAQCQLRSDYVEGTETSPVGYLEGIYVAQEHRHQGHARALLHACQMWAKEKGCTEFASDCELGNAPSLSFHMACDFEEAGRIICFVKKL